MSLNIISLNAVASIAQPVDSFSININSISLNTSVTVTAILTYKGAHVIARTYTYSGVQYENWASSDVYLVEMVTKSLMSEFGVSFDNVMVSPIAAAEAKAVAEAAEAKAEAEAKAAAAEAKAKAEAEAAAAEAKAEAKAEAEAEAVAAEPAAAEAAAAESEPVAEPDV